MFGGMDLALVKGKAVDFGCLFYPFSFEHTVLNWCTVAVRAVHCCKEECWWFYSWQY